MLKVLLAALFGAMLYGAIRYAKFRLKNARAWFIRELIINERQDRRRRQRTNSFLKIREVWCEQSLTGLRPDGTHHGYLAADALLGRELVVHAYYRPGETDRPYDLTMLLIEADGRYRTVRWQAPEGRSLAESWRDTLLFMNEGLLTLEALDQFAKELGHDGLKPPKPNV